MALHILRRPANNEGIPGDRTSTPHPKSSEVEKSGIMPVPSRVGARGNDISAALHAGEFLRDPVFASDAAPTDREPPSEWSVVMTWNKLIRKTLTHYGVPCIDLEDETDKAVLLVVSEWHKYQEARGDVESWIKGICFNVYRNYRKQARVRRHSGEDISKLNIVSVQNDPQEIVAAIEARDIILSILDLMGDEVFAQIWWLWNFEECTAGAIADARGVTEKQARRLIEKAEISFAKAKVQYESAKVKVRLEKANLRKGGR